MFRPPWQPQHLAKVEASKRHDDRRGSARERGYDNRWDKARKFYLIKHPLCVCCEANGVAHAATVVDHVEPHKGDMVKFWNSAMWQGLCDWCDKSIKRPLENRWLRDGGSIHVLHLNRRISGWVHPALRHGEGGSNPYTSSLPDRRG